MTIIWFLVILVFVWWTFRTTQKIFSLIKKFNALDKELIEVWTELRNLDLSIAAESVKIETIKNNNLKNVSTTDSNNNTLFGKINALEDYLGIEAKIQYVLDESYGSEKWIIKNALANAKKTEKIKYVKKTTKKKPCEKK